MNYRAFLPAALAAFVVLGSALPATAAEYAPRRAPLAAAAQTDQARVVVKFRADAPTLRAQALSTNDREGTARVLGARAQTLAVRAGVALASGHAVGERIQVVTASGIGSAALAARLAMDPEVEYAEPVQRARALAVPNEWFYNSGGASGPAVGQWYLHAPVGEAQAAINAQTAWDSSKGGSAGAGVIVAVLDTGVRFDHPDLAGKLLAGYDMVTDVAAANDGNGRDSDPSDPGDWVSAADKATTTFASCDIENSSWHGTQIAGLIGAATDNGLGIAGAGWNARVLPVRVLGKCGGESPDIAAGIRWAAGVAVPGVPANPNKARVINLSLGGKSGVACDHTYQDAINDAIAAGVTVVAAAGNSDGHALGSPANCRGVIAVAGLRHTGTKVGYSDAGPEVSLSAPAGNCVNPSGACLYPIMSTTNSGTTTPAASGYTNGTTDLGLGTSFSAPLTAATAALVLAAQPTLTPAQVKTILQRSARAFPGAVSVPRCHAPDGSDQSECACTTTTCGAGMLDAAGAVAMAISAVVTPVIFVDTELPTAKQSVIVSAGRSSVGSGRSIAAYNWELLSGSSAGGSFVSATNGAAATYVPSRSGTAVVRLTITDDLGVSASTDTQISIAAAAGGGGGGGAMSAGWLAALAAATLALARLRRGMRASRAT